MHIRALIVVLVLMLPSFSQAATLYLDPAEGSYGLTDTFIVNVRLDNDDACVNAAEVAIRYPTDTLRAVDFSRGGSIFTLWAGEPVLDTERGMVTFSGGVPGGYCGRIPGDPVLSNVLGKIVFSVVGADADKAAIDFMPTSAVYLNDGRGTKAETTTSGAALSIADTPQLQENAWLSQVGEDDLPPDPFRIIVESTRGVFGGKYYAVFSTVDKQSGMSHFEIYERGAWKRIESPYQLRDQSLRGGVQIKAIDKAGNERMGEYAEGSAPPRQTSWMDYSWIIAIIIVLCLIGAAKWIMDRRRPPVPPAPAPSA